VPATFRAHRKPTARVMSNSPTSVPTLAKSNCLPQGDAPKLQYCPNLLKSIFLSRPNPLRDFRATPTRYTTPLFDPLSSVLHEFRRLYGLVPTLGPSTRLLTLSPPHAPVSTGFYPVGCEGKIHNIWWISSGQGQALPVQSGRPCSFLTVDFISLSYPWV